MRGKLGLVIGLGVGYVLGARAGRKRYEQIKAQAERLWELEPVQKQVSRVKDAAKSSAMAIPRAAWDGAVKVVQKATSDDGTPGQKVDAAIDEAKATVDDVKRAASDSTAEAGAGDAGKPADG